MISHGVSHFKNFMGREEYKKTSPDLQMMAPYKRVVVMHLTVMAAGFFVSTIGTPVYSLLVLVILKTLIDLGSHIFEHRNYEKN